MEIESKSRSMTSANNKKKAHQGSKNKGYYTNQKLRTMRNKRRRAEIRAKNEKDPKRKQPSDFVRPAKINRLARREKKRVQMAAVEAWNMRSVSKSA